MADFFTPISVIFTLLFLSFACTLFFTSPCVLFFNVLNFIKLKIKRRKRDRQEAYRKLLPYFHHITWRIYLHVIEFPISLKMTLDFHTLFRMLYNRLRSSSTLVLSTILLAFFSFSPLSPMHQSKRNGKTGGKNRKMINLKFSSIYFFIAGI